MYSSVNNVMSKVKKEDLEIIIKEYPFYGSKKCMELTNLTLNSVLCVVNKYKLKILNRSQHILNYKSKIKTVFNPTYFIDEMTKESVYILGLLWADGSLGNDKNCDIRVEIVKEDLDKLSEIFKKTGKWNYYERTRNKWKPIASFVINNRTFFNFLIENDYKNKSLVSPFKIIDIIPENLKHYFFRGLIDGDGCFYINQKQYTYQFTITSSYEQDWSYLENLLKNYDIKYSICKRQSINKKTEKMNRSSVLRITNKNDIKKFGEFIYKDYDSDQMGLNRKYKIFEQIKFKCI
jgi:hypothetical protein